MDRNRVTVRYAKALIELATEQNVLKLVDRDIRILFTALNQHQGFAEYVLNPGHSSKDKFTSVKTIFTKDFHPLSMNFLRLVFDHNREEYLKDLCRNILEMSRQQNGVLTAKLITAEEIDPSLIDQIKTKFEKKIKSTLEMTSEVDSNLIGGFVFTIDGQQYDASVASRLKDIKKQLQF
jgi:F-type H+-transporting ATPase subunit delta